MARKRGLIIKSCYGVANWHFRKLFDAHENRFNHFLSFSYWKGWEMGFIFRFLENAGAESVSLRCTGGRGINMRLPSASNFSRSKRHKLYKTFPVCNSVWCWLLVPSCRLLGVSKSPLSVSWEQTRWIGETMKPLYCVQSNTKVDLLALMEDLYRAIGILGI